MLIGMTYDLREDYLAEGFSHEAAAEFDSSETINALEKAIHALGYEVERIGNVKSLVKALASGAKWDLVFNIAEGIKGLAREAQVPALLEAYDIPYTFSPPEVMVTCHDKALAKALVARAKLKTAPWHVIRSLHDLSTNEFVFPLFAKPLAEGTGKGISQMSVIGSQTQLRSVVSNLLQQFSQPVLLETYLTGREFTVGVLGSAETASIIAVLEILSKPGAEAGGHTFYNKENCEKVMEYVICTDPVAQQAGELALAVWKTLGGCGAGRVDIRCDADNTPNFLEVNPLPGLHPTHSDLPILASKIGLSFSTLIKHIIDNALARYHLQRVGEKTLCAS